MNQLVLTKFGGWPQYAINTMVYHYAIATSIPESGSKALKSNEILLFCLLTKIYGTYQKCGIYD